MSAAYTRLLQTCEQAVLEPMAYVAAWKRGHPGAKAVGYLPTYVPLEPIYAAGSLPVGLWGGDVPISVADAHIQQFTCSLVRSVSEYAFTGAFKALDAVLFPPICDSLKQVGSIWALKLSDQFLVEMANLPERLDTPAAAAFLQAELKRLSAALGGPAPADELEADRAMAPAIAAVNRLRRAMQGFSDWRGARAVPLAEACTVLRAATVLHADDYCPLVEALLAEDAPPPANPPGVPVVVSGLSCQLPHPALLRCFEEAGLRVVDDDLLLGLRGSAEVDADGNPYAQIARAYCRSAPMAIRHVTHAARHERLLVQVRRHQARGIVYMVPKFCEPEEFDLRHLQQETGQAQLKSVVIDFEEGPGATGPVQTRLAAFAETLA